MCPDDEVMLLDEEDNVVPFGEVGEFCVRGPYTLRGYFAADEHNARAFTNDGFYRSGDLLRQHPSGNYMVEGPDQGPDQPRRREDLGRGDRESDPHAPLGAQRGLRADARSRAWASACAPI